MITLQAHSLQRLVSRRALRDSAERICVRAVVLITRTPGICFAAQPALLRCPSLHCQADTHRLLGRARRRCVA
jgi:hypothetical protein